MGGGRGRRHTWEVQVQVRELHKALSGKTRVRGKPTTDESHCTTHHRHTMGRVRGKPTTDDEHLLNDGKLHIQAKVIVAS